MTTYRSQATKVFAVALLQGEVSLETRVNTLSKYLRPSPKEILEVDTKIADEFGKKDQDHGRIYGEIEVAPPPGHCFTITRSPDRPDETVCKKKRIKWQLRDLEIKTGQLNWSISTGAGDFGTPITWKTDYRIAKFIPSKFEFNEESSTPLFIRQCIATPKDIAAFKGRRITLTFFNGESWTIKFPDKDIPIPPWEPPAPTPPPDDKKKKPDPHAAPEAAPSAPPSPSPTPPPMEAWTLSTRRGFTMGSDQVLSNRMPPSSKKGDCRYQYDGDIGNFDSGRIECHYGDGFTYFYAPLTCMKYLQK